MPAPLFVSCPCGKKIPVHAGMAGSEVVCECGRSVNVPTLRELTRLAVSDSEQGLSVGNDPLIPLRASLAHDQPPAGVNCIVCQSATDHAMTCELDGWQSGWEDPATPWIARWLRRRLSRSKPSAQDAQSGPIRFPVRICAACFRRAGDIEKASVLRRLLDHSALFREISNAYPRSSFRYRKSH